MRWTVASIPRTTQRLARSSCGCAASQRPAMPPRQSSENAIRRSSSPTFLAQRSATALNSNQRRNARRSCRSRRRSEPNAAAKSSVSLRRSCGVRARAWRAVNSACANGSLQSHPLRGSVFRPENAGAHRSHRPMRPRRQGATPRTLSPPPGSAAARLRGAAGESPARATARRRSRRTLNWPNPPNLGQQRGDLHAVFPNAGCPAGLGPQRSSDRTRNITQ